MAEVLHARVAQLPVRLAANDREFLAYAGVHLGPLRSEAVGEPIIDATLVWHDHPPPERFARYRELEQMERLDRDLFRGGDRLWWFRVDELPGLQLRFSWDGTRLSVHGDFHHFLSAEPIRDRIKRWIYWRRVRELRRRRFTTLLYYLLYYPALWWLERNRGFHPIHAGAVAMRGGGVIVVAGPSGVGKSTLTVALAGEPEAALLSDGFVLHDGDDMRALYEPMLLSDWSQQWLGEGAQPARRITWRYCLDRSGFHWPQERLTHGGRAELLILPRRVSSAYVRRLSAAEAHGQISARDQIVNDLRRYWAFAAVLEAFAPGPLMYEREKQIEALTARVPCYELGLASGQSRPEVIGIIRDLAMGRARERCAVACGA